MKHHPRPTTPSVRPLAATCAALLAVLCALPRPASAQEPQFRNSGPPPLPTDTLRTLPRGAYTTGTETGIPSHTLFRDTGAPYTHALRNLELDPSVHSESVEGRFHLDLPSIRGDFPLLDRGFEPQDADLKIGPAFFKLRAFSLGLLVTDNKNLSENDRDADVIGIVRLTASVVIQLTEGFRIATTGSFVYLPFENKAGVAGFELVAPYTFGLAATPAFRTQIAWDTMIAGWPVTFADEVVLGVGRYSRSTRDDFELFEGGDFDEVDRAGRHVFRAPRRKHRDQDGRDIERDPDFNYLSNTVSASTERRLPADIQMNARIFREDLWYNQGRRGLPNLREGADLILREER